MLNFFAALPSAWPRHGAASFLELEADGAALQPIDHAGSAELRRWVSAIKGEGPGMRCAREEEGRRICRSEAACAVESPPVAETMWRTCETAARPVSAAVGSSSGCLVVSVGIGGEWAFEDALVKAGCEVHAFDPTSDLRASHEAHARAGDAKLHFHYVGLGAGANYTAANHSNSYGALSSEFLPLDALIATAKRGRDVPLTILKVDCEGCEWDAFADAARRAPHALDDVSMLMIELHLTERLGMRDAASLSTLMRHVVGDHRFRLSRQHTNHGFAVDWNAARPELVRAGWEAHPCCAELHFVRAPDGAEQAAERERGGGGQASGE